MANFFNWLDRKVFPRPLPKDLMAETLENATIELLKAQDGLDYASSVVNYRKAQIERLTKQLAANSGTNPINTRNS